MVINGQEVMILIEALTSELACIFFTALNQLTHFDAEEKKIHQRRFSLISRVFAMSYQGKRHFQRSLSEFCHFAGCCQVRLTDGPQFRQLTGIDIPFVFSEWRQMIYALGAIIDSEWGRMGGGEKTSLSSPSGQLPGFCLFCFLLLFFVWGGS